MKVALETLGFCIYVNVILAPTTHLTSLTR